MTDTNNINTIPGLITPTISKPAVGSSASATIRRPTQPPSVPQNSTTSNSGPTTQHVQIVDPSEISNAESSSSTTTPEFTPSTPTFEMDLPHSSHPPSHPPPPIPVSSTSSHPSTENEDENESWTSEQTVDSSGGDEDQEEQADLGAEDNDDPTKQKIWALVKFSYEAGDSEELTLQPDEVIEILEQNDDGWWKGRNVFGKAGIFPYNLVTLVDDPTTVKSSPAPAAPAAALAPFGDSLPFTTTSSSSSPALALKKARHSIFQKKKTKDDDHHSFMGTSPSGYPLSPSSASPSRKNSHDKNKKDRRSQTLSSGSSPSNQLTKSSSTKIVSSPSMPSLPILSNKATRSPSQSTIQPMAIRTSGSDVPPPVQPPSPHTSSTSSAFSSVSIPTSPQVSFSTVPTTPTSTTIPSPTLTSTPTPSSTTSIPTPASPSLNSSGETPPLSPNASGADSFIMKVHIPPSGFSQFKVVSNQTIGDLVAMVAKKRMIAAKDCSLRLPSAPATEPPLDPSTSISSLGTKEVRLFVAGEPIPTATAATVPGVRPISSGASSSNNLLGGATTYAPAASGRTNKEGYLLKADNNKKMKKVWVTLDKNFVYFYKTALDKNPTERISLYCATPKLSMEPKKKTYFDLVTVTNTFNFSADNENEAIVWVNAMQEACQALIMKQIGATSSEPAAPAVERFGSKDQKTREILQQIRDLPDNNICAECSAPKPDWAAINLGIFFCIDCSGIHRSMGVHISQVRSVSLDHWDMSQIVTMETMGNKKANDFWEHNIPPGFHKPTPKSSADEREEWIRAKYQQKQFVDNSRTPLTNFNGTIETPPTPPPTRPGRTNTPPINSALAAFLPPEAIISAAPTPTQTSIVSPTPIHPPANASPVLSASNNNVTPPQSATASPVLSRASSTASSSQGAPQKLPGMDFVGYGFLSYQDESRPILKRLIKLLKNTYDENRTVHVAAQNAPSGAWRDVEYQVVDQLSVDTSSVRGYIPMSTKVFEKLEDLNKFLSTHLQPQLDSYRQTVMMESENSKSAAAETERWYVIVEVRMELYELFVDQLDEEGLSPHVVKASPLLADGDPAFLYQFIKKTGTHFVRSAVYGGRYLMKTIVEKSQVPDKDEAIKLCQQHFRALYEGETNPTGIEKVNNYTLEITGGDNRKRGIEWIASIWDRPQVLSYDMESISTVFDDLTVSVKVDAAATEFLAKMKNP